MPYSSASALHLFYWIKNLAAEARISDGRTSLNVSLRIDLKREADGSYINNYHWGYVCGWMLRLLTVSPLSPLIRGSSAHSDSAQAAVFARLSHWGRSPSVL